MLILDEPLDSLDLANQSRSRPSSNASAGRDGVAVLLVAHDVNPLLGYLDRVVYLAGGRALSGTPEEVITGRDAVGALRRADRGAARGATGGSSSSASRRRAHHHGGRHEH